MYRTIAILVCTEDLDESITVARKALQNIIEKGPIDFAWIAATDEEIGFNPEKALSRLVKQIDGAEEGEFSSGFKSQKEKFEKSGFPFTFYEEAGNFVNACSAHEDDAYKMFFGPQRLNVPQGLKVLTNLRHIFPNPGRLFDEGGKAIMNPDELKDRLGDYTGTVRLVFAIIHE